MQISAKKKIFCFEELPLGSILCRLFIFFDLKHETWNTIPNGTSLKDLNLKCYQNTRVIDLARLIFESMRSPIGRQVQFIKSDSIPGKVLHAGVHCPVQGAMLRDVSRPQNGSFLEKVRKRGRGHFRSKNVIEFLLYSERYILVLNFGENVQKGGRGIISNPKIS